MVELFKKKVIKSNGTQPFYKNLQDQADNVNFDGKG